MGITHEGAPGKLDVVTVKIDHERYHALDIRNNMVHDVSDVPPAIRELFSGSAQEVVGALNLTSSGRIINLTVISKGTLRTALVSTGDVLRGALLSNASSVILFHNHPSGSAEPSGEDISLTYKAALSLGLVDVKLLDHVIIGEGDEVYSFARERPDALSFDGAKEMLSGLVAEDGAAYGTGGADQSLKKVRENRKRITEELSEYIRTGNTLIQEDWSRAAMRPQNPVSGVFYKGANRLILMASVIRNRYQDPRWMTFEQLKSRGYHVKKGEHGTLCEKWVFDKKEPLVDEHGNAVLDADGKPVMETRLLERPKAYPFVVFNAEQTDVPPLDISKDPSGITDKVENLRKASPCPVIHAAQGRSYYDRKRNEIVLPVRQAFYTEEGYAATLAHEMVHATGHVSLLNRTFGTRDPWSGEPDEAYCLEELKAEIGAAFLLADTGITDSRDRVRNSAGYIDGYIRAMKADPNVLFRCAKDAEKAEEMLLERYSLYAMPEAVITPLPDIRKEKAEEAAKDTAPAKTRSRRNARPAEKHDYDFDAIDEMLLAKQREGVLSAKAGEGQDLRV